jgi:hypothetical protein
MNRPIGLWLLAVVALLGWGCGSSTADRSELDLGLSADVLEDSGPDGAGDRDGVVDPKEAGALDAPGPGEDGWVLGDGGDLDVVPAEPGVRTSCTKESWRAGDLVPFACKLVGVENPEVFALSLLIEGPGETTEDALKVEFQTAGVYSIHCVAKAGDTEFTDEDGVQVVVLPGAATSIQTSLSKDSIISGDWVEVTCVLADEFGNLVETPPSLDTAPVGGLEVLALKLQGRRTGKYEIACVDPESGAQDLTPALLTVKTGPTVKVVTLLSAEQTPAGVPVQVSCKARDAWNNDVVGFKLTVDHPAAVQLLGFDLSGTVAGFYKITCVPQDEPWNYFKLEPKTLQVVPGPAAAVLVTTVPDKPFFKVLETVEIKASAVDGYGNLVEGVSFQPAQVLPLGAGVKPAGGKNRFLLEAEGVYDFVVCILDAPEVCGSKTLAVDGFGPVINIEYPARGAALSGPATVEVRGTVVDTINGVARFRINSTDVPVAEDGSFVFAMQAKEGLNMILVLAEDPNGFKTLVAQSFYYSTVWLSLEDGVKVQNGLKFFLSQQFFDDGNHDPNDPNDLATILEVTMGSVNLGSLIPNPAAQVGEYKIYLGGVSYQKPTVKLNPDPGVLRTELNISNFTMHVDATAKCMVWFVDVCPDVGGSISISGIRANIDTGFTVVNGTAASTSHNTSVALSGIDINLDSGILNFLLGWLLDWLANSFSGMIEDAAASMVNGQLDSLMASLVSALAINMDLEIPNPLLPDAAPVSVNFSSAVWNLAFENDGLSVDLNADARAARTVAHEMPGSFGRGTCYFDSPGGYVMDKQSNTEVALADNMINRILHAAWAAGIMNLTVPLEQIMDPSELVLEGFGSLEDLGISNIVARTDFTLPPILTTCSQDGSMLFHAGDAYVELTMDMFGQPVSMGLYASMSAPANIDLVEGPLGQSLSLGIGDFDPLYTQVTYVSENLKGAEGFMTMLVQGVILPQLLGGLTENALASFQLPSIKLKDLSPMLPANLALTIYIDQLVHRHGYTGMNSHIQSSPQ